MHPLRILFVILCVALVYYTASHKPFSPSSGQNNPSELSAAAEATIPLQAPATSSDAADLKQHNYTHLKDFILPEMHFEKATAQEAVAALIQHYNDVCRTTGEIPLQFNTNFEGAALGTVEMSVSGSFQHILERIAIYSGLELEQNRSHLHFHALPKQQAMVSQKIRVPANFEYLVGLSLDEHECTEEHEQQSSVNAYLKTKMHLSPQSSLVYNAHNATLQIEGSETDLYRITKLVQLTQKQKAAEITTHARLFSAPLDSDIPTDKVLSDKEAEQILANVEQQTDFQLSGQETFTSMNGERSTVSKTQEVAVRDATSNELYNDWKGYRITTSSDLLGLGLQSYTRVEYNIPIANSQQLAFHDKEANHYLHPNENVIIKSHETPGMAHYITLTKSIQNGSSDQLASH